MTSSYPAAPSGVLLVDKPSGRTSFDVIRVLKPRIKPGKMGHTGTLDPMATGLLPVCIGEATKLVPLLAEDSKRYRAVVRLGVTTTTLDREGDPAGSAPVPALDRAKIENCLQGFRGSIQQVPPMYSAIHHKGRRMYQLAREGVTVERKPRPVHIHRLDLVGFDGEQLEIDVTCSTGTYIRTLAADIAVCLGTLGHLEQLVRTACGGWTLAQATPLDVLMRSNADALRQAILPLEQVLAAWPRVDVDADWARRLSQGQNLPAKELTALGIVPAEKPLVIWFRAPEGSPLVLARIDRDNQTNAPHMQIVRVLLP